MPNCKHRLDSTGPSATVPALPSPPEEIYLHAGRALVGGSVRSCSRLASRELPVQGCLTLTSSSVNWPCWLTKDNIYLSIQATVFNFSAAMSHVGLCQLAWSKLICISGTPFLISVRTSVQTSVYLQTSFTWFEDGVYNMQWASSECLCSYCV